MIRLALLLTALVAASCSPVPAPAPSPTPTPSPSPTPSPTATLVPAATPTPHPADAEYEAVVVTVGEGVFTALVADTDAKRSLGLGGRDALALGAAMLFDFEGPVERWFWMRGMRFALDIIWIDEAAEVVHVTRDVPPPAADTPNADLPRYGAGVPVRWVLEVNAGLADALGVTAGVRVMIGEAVP